MRKKFFCLFVLLFLIFISFQKEDIIYPEVSDKQYVQVSTSEGNLIIDLDNYLVGVIAGEMPLTFEDEALKAQIVASRTFVFSRGLSVSDDTSSQVYLTENKQKEKWQENYGENYQRIMNLIKETNNEVMTYNDQYISAMFFSSSNGYTENNEDYFNVNATPYLRSVESSWDLTIDPNNTRIKTFSKSELESIFNTSNLSFHILSYKESGRVETIKVNDKTYTGREIRELLGLASSDFSITCNDGIYTFTTSGYGHGVGMSQYGAQGMALEGYTYKEILNYYYEDIEIESLDV